MLRCLMFIIAVGALLAGPASAADDPMFEFDWLATFKVAGEHCPGQTFSRDGIDLRMKQIGDQLGWSPAKLFQEAEARQTSNQKSFAESDTAFCSAAGLGRKQISDERLRQAGVIY